MWYHTYLWYASDSYMPYYAYIHCHKKASLENPYTWVFTSEQNWLSFLSSTDSKNLLTKTHISGSTELRKIAKSIKLQTNQISSWNTSLKYSHLIYANIDTRGIRTGVDTTVAHNAYHYTTSSGGEAKITLPVCWIANTCLWCATVVLFEREREVYLCICVSFISLLPCFTTTIECG